MCQFNIFILIIKYNISVSNVSWLYSAIQRFFEWPSLFSIEWEFLLIWMSKVQRLLGTIFSVFYFLNVSLILLSFLTNEIVSCAELFTVDKNTFLCSDRQFFIALSYFSISVALWKLLFSLLLSGFYKFHLNRWKKLAHISISSQHQLFRYKKVFSFQILLCSADLIFSGLLYFEILR